MSKVPNAKIDPKKTAVSLEFKHNRPLTACHWEPKSRYIFFGAQDNLVHRFDTTNKKTISLQAHDSWVRSYGSSIDGEILYSGGYDGRLILWPANAETPKPIGTIQAHDGWVRAIAVSPDGKYVATCGNDLLVKIWNAKDASPVKQFAGHKSHVYNIAFTQDSKSIVSCDHKGFVKAWSLERNKARDLETVKDLHGYDTTFRADIGGARSIAWRTDGAQVAFGGISKVTNAFAGVGEIAVAVVNLADGKVARVLRAKEKTRGAVWGLAHHPNGFWIGLSGGGGGVLTFWKGDTEHEFFKLKLKSDGRGMSISPDRTQLVVAHADNHLRTYRLHAAS